MIKKPSPFSLSSPLQMTPLPVHTFATPPSFPSSSSSYSFTCTHTHTHTHQSRLQRLMTAARWAFAQKTIHIRLSLAFWAPKRGAEVGKARKPEFFTEESSVAFWPPNRTLHIRPFALSFFSKWPPELGVRVWLEWLRIDHIFFLSPCSIAVVLFPCDLTPFLHRFHHPKNFDEPKIDSWNRFDRHFCISFADISRVDPSFISSSSVTDSLLCRDISLVLSLPSLVHITRPSFSSPRSTLCALLLFIS